MGAPTAGASPTDSPEASATPAQETSTETPAAGTVSPDDPAILAGAVEFAADGETLLGYLSRPRGEGVYPVILVCHENRGLTEHIQDVTRRLAKAGYVALAVDLLSRLGGSEALGADQVPGALGNIPPEQFVQDFLSGWRYLQGQAFAQAERVGMVGFCFGGGVTWRVATRMAELLAAVPFYGPHPPVEDVPKIQAAVLAIYGELDQRINQGIPAIEEAMQKNGKIYEKVIYPGADHAFHNDTGPRYKPDAARDAWDRTLGWFERYVKSA
jgi:carboxymethylenebutenolidase